MKQLPPPPREVEALYPHVILKAMLWTIFIATIPVAIFFVGIAIDGLLLQTVGRDVTAHVISAEENPDAIFGSYTRTAAFAYTLPGNPERTDDSAGRNGDILNFPEK